MIGKPAPAFTLQDYTGSFFNFLEIIKVSPVILVFYPGDFTPVCTKQLCDYRDHMQQFHNLGIQLFGISKNDRASHKRFAEEHCFPFPLLTDLDNKVAKKYGCSSLFMLGNISRAIFLVNTKGMILYRYIEPTVVTRRTSSDLIKVVNQLRKNKLI